VFEGLQGLKVQKAIQERQACRDRKAMRVKPGPPDRRAPPATLVQLAQWVRTARRESWERWGLLAWKDRRATPEPVDRREQKAIQGQRDPEGRKAIAESPRRKDPRVTRASSGLRDPLVSRGHKA
jgi:hypothetical protein